MKRILVTGGTGYIGSHTVVELLQADYEVVIIDDLSNSKEEVLHRIKKITGKEPAFYPYSLLDFALCESVFQKEKIDGVIHFAGFKAVGESVKDPLKYYENNLYSTIVLLKLMKKYHVHDLVFSSSATVYGIPEYSPILETMETGKVFSPYGRTKYMIEEILKDVAVAEPSWNITLLRYFNPIGAHPSGEIGEDPHGIPNNLMPYITQVAIGKIHELGVFGNDYDTKDGTGVRDYIHVVDLAKGHLAALHKMEENPGLLVYNLGTGCGVSVLELVHAFEKANHMTIPYRIAPRREGDIAIYYADCHKANVELQWKAEYSIEDACRHSWNWQIKNPKGYGDE